MHVILDRGHRCSHDTDHAAKPGPADIFTEKNSIYY